MSHPLPVSAEAVRSALDFATGQLAPAPIEEVAVKLDQTMRLWDLPKGWDDEDGAVSGFYLEAVEHLPSDLLDLALKRVRLHHKWPRAPKPADFAEAVKEELAERREAVQSLRRAEMKARLDGRKPTQPAKRGYADLSPAEREAFDRRTSEILEQIKNGGANRMLIHPHEERRNV